MIYLNQKFSYRAEHRSPTSTHLLKPQEHFDHQFHHWCDSFNKWYKQSSPHSPDSWLATYANWGRRSCGMCNSILIMNSTVYQYSKTYLLIVEECWMSIMASTFTCRGIASKNVHLFPNKVLSRHYLFKLHLFSLPIPTSSPQPPPLAHSRFKYFICLPGSSPPLNPPREPFKLRPLHEYFLCHLERPFLILILIPTLPGQKISAHSL